MRRCLHSAIAESLLIGSKHSPHPRKESGSCGGRLEDGARFITANSDTYYVFESTLGRDMRQ